MRAIALFVLVGCGATSGTRGEEPTPTPPDAAPVAVTAPPPSEPEGLYTLADAVADIHASPLVHLGTGPWHGIHRIPACAYRNERVLVVNVYCSKKEQRAFRVDVYSPARGRVRIYAEGRVPVSTLTRDQYFTFKAESDPPPPAEAGLPAVQLSMSFAELADYERRRYEKFLPSCFGGVEIGKPQGACLDALAPRYEEWSAANASFLERPPDDWYRLVRQLRALAQKDGGSGR